MLDPVWVRTGELVNLVYQCFWPFGFFPYGHAGCFKEERFFLETPGVGKEGFGVVQKLKHIKVTDRGNCMDIGEILVGKAFDF